MQTALPGSPGATYLQQRGIPLALEQQLGVGYAAPGTWPHPARDWRGDRVVFPHTPPEGYPVWPLWYVAFAMTFVRTAGGFFVLGLLVNAVLA